MKSQLSHPLTIFFVSVFIHKKYIIFAGSNFGIAEQYENLLSYCFLRDYPLVMNLALVMGSGLSNFSLMSHKALKTSFVVNNREIKKLLILVRHG